MKPIRAKGKSKLSDIDPNETGGLDKKKAAKLLEDERLRIADLQEKLYAENEQSLLVVLQGMDTSGKSGTINAVFTAVNPHGLEVTGFGPPSALEADHDFLWRIHQRLPRRGNIGVFDRSHYEDVLVVRVKKLVPEKAWKARYAQINEFEKLAGEHGTRILKFFLHIDRAEQKERLEARLADKDKNWKFRLGDLEDRTLWDEFQAAYEDVLDRCSTEQAPWYIVPANKKWYRNVLIARTVADTLDEMKPRPRKSDLDPSKIQIPD
jgi:PPK2 family polyphosphate:nucleotide phosphotransferase